MPGGYEWLILGVLLLLLFGAKKLPEVARSVGRSARVVTGEMTALRQDVSRARELPSGTPSSPQPAHDRVTSS